MQDPPGKTNQKQNHQYKSVPLNRLQLIPPMPSSYSILSVYLVLYLRTVVD